MDLDPLLLSRIQFAFTISFHIIFPSFTIGLAAWLATIEGMWLATGNPVYRRVFDFWLKVFAVSFGMGVVSGIVLSYQFGTNWSRFSVVTGNVIGPAIGNEVLTAFDHDRQIYEDTRRKSDPRAEAKASRRPILSSSVVRRARLISRAISRFLKRSATTGRTRQRCSTTFVARCRLPLRAR